MNAESKSSKNSKNRSDNKREKRNKEWRMPVLVILLCCVIIAAIPAAIWFYEESFLYTVCKVEAGTVLEASDFTKNTNEDACFEDGSTTISTDEVGEFTVRIRNGFFIHTSKLVVEDTVAPVAEAQDVQILYGQTCSPKAFVINIEEATTVEITYTNEPDWSLYGTQNVEICLTDEAGNTSLLTAELSISPIYLEISVEAGCEGIEVSDFEMTGVDASFVTRVDMIDYSAVGDYTVMIRVGREVYSSVLHVVDTIAPVVTTCDVEGYPRFDLQAEDFIVTVKDVTEVTAEFVGTPDLTKTGTQELRILITDEGGNTTEETVTLTNLEDTELPVISGAEDITTYTGESVSYLDGVTVTDNSGDTLELKIDNSKVNLNEPGSYPVTYATSDASGNEVSVTVTLTVQDPKYSREEVYELANQVLDDILTDDMTDYEIVYAIYYYTYHHISYVDTSEKGDWLCAAYEGFVYGKGDCYTYACTAQALYNCAGITNMMIEKIPAGDSLHYWNLVDIGDGWYHVDCTPRVGHPTIFMWTDAELMEYSESHSLSHNYDHSKYPETN